MEEEKREVVFDWANGLTKFVKEYSHLFSSDEVWNVTFAEEEYQFKIWNESEVFEEGKLITVQLFRSSLDLYKVITKVSEEFVVKQNAKNENTKQNTEEEISFSYLEEEEFDEEEVEEIFKGEVSNLHQMKEIEDTEEYNNEENEIEEEEEEEDEERFEEDEKINYKEEEKGVEDAADISPDLKLFNETEEDKFSFTHVKIDENEIILLFVCVSNSLSENRNYVIFPDKISEFLEKHKKNKFLVENCVEFFKIMRYFATPHIDINSSNIIGERDELLWEMVNEGRLFDLRVINTLLKLAEKNQKCHLSNAVSIIKENTSIKLLPFINFHRRKMKNSVEKFIHLNENSQNEFRSKEEFQNSELFSIFFNIFKPQIIISIGIKNAYLLISNKSRHLMSYYAKLIYSDAERKYGLLTQTIQVKSAIATSFMSNNGVTIHYKDILQFFFKINNLIEIQTKELMELDLSRNLFYLDGYDGKIKTINDRVSIPLINYGRLQEILSFIQSDILYHFNIKIPPITVNVDTVFNLRLVRWKCYSHLHPFISRWINFQKSVYLCYFVENYLTLLMKNSPHFYPSIYHFIDDHIHLLNEENEDHPNDLPNNQSYSNNQSNDISDSLSESILTHKSIKQAKLHPHWNFLLRNGRVGCRNPNIPFTPKDYSFRRIIKPSKGNVLLVVDLNFIELCTFSAICEHRFSYSNLGRVIRSGADPHCYTSALFSGLPLDVFVNLLNNNENHSSLNNNNDNNIIDNDNKNKIDNEKENESEIKKNNEEENGIEMEKRMKNIFYEVGTLINNENENSNNINKVENNETKKEINYGDVRSLAKIMNFSVASGIGSRSLQILIFNILGKEFVFLFVIIF